MLILKLFFVKLHFYQIKIQMNQLIQKIISFSFLIFFLGLTTLSYSQKRAIVEIDVENFNSEALYSKIGEIPLKSTNQFLAVSAVLKSQNWNAEKEIIQIRFSKDKKAWSKWEKLKEDPHSKKITDRYISNLIFAEEGSRFFEIQKQTPDQISRLKIHFFNPEKMPETHPNNTIQTRDACDCEQPQIILRTDWCPDGSCFPHPNPSNTNVTHLIVHHTAGSNTSSDWTAVVRSIWDFHVNINGWSDIGYNFLIDPEGNIYDGRGNDVRGAHFCGTNSGTMGTAMMGNFTDISPTSEALNALTKLLAWKNCDRDLDALGAAFHASSGKTLDHISGHRDGCATECPGNSFYPLFPDVRQTVQDFIDNNCQNTSTKNPFLNEQTVQISPNPTSGNLNIGIDNLLFGNLNIRVFDNQLKMVLTNFKNFKTGESQTFNMNLIDLESGIYFLQLDLNGEKSVFKIIKN